MMETVQLKQWSSNLFQSMLSLTGNLGAILAGTLFSQHFDVFSLTPWAIILFPGILSIRGAIGGLFSARLSTALHLGTIRSSYTKNTQDFYLLLYVIITLALLSSFMMGLVTTLIGRFLWGASILDTIIILNIITATMGLSLIFISPITIAVSFYSFKRGLNPDIIVYPIVATIADVIITSCYVFILKTFFITSNYGWYLINVINLVFIVIVVYTVLRYFKEKEFIQIIKEFFFTLVVVAFIVNITGSFLYKLSDGIGDRKEIYMVYPALIDTIGSVGSIIGSTATTKLALGVIKSSFSSIREHFNEIGSAWSASVVMFIVFAIISSIVNEVNVVPDVLVFIFQLVVTNVLAVSCIAIIAYVLAIFIYRRGWDPDNFVIPLESSVADSITTIFLLLVLSII